MRRVNNKKSSKRAFTLVELVVCMALTSIFAASCVLLILPITQIYKHTNDLSRAQLLADTVVDSLRSECAGVFVSSEDDVWIAAGGADGMSAAATVNSGPVLVIRRNRTYCETIAANYAITRDMRDDIYSHSDESHSMNLDGVTSRSIYRLIPATPTPVPAVPQTLTDLSEGVVHFGYFELDTDSTNSNIYPAKRYDFINPFGYATYRDFHVALTFSGITCDANDVPVYCLCKVDILDVNDQLVYSREVVLCFS